MPFSCSTTCSCVEPISTGLTIGPPACSVRSAARPSQNCAVLYVAFRTVGELRPPFCQRWPSETGARSTPPVPRLWQVLQLMLCPSDRRGSKNNALPSSTAAGSGAGSGDCGIGSKRASASSRSTGSAARAPLVALQANTTVAKSAFRTFRFSRWDSLQKGRIGAADCIDPDQSRSRSRSRSRFGRATWRGHGSRQIAVCGKVIARRTVHTFLPALGSHEVRTFAPLERGGACRQSDQLHPTSVPVLPSRMRRSCPPNAEDQSLPPAARRGLSPKGQLPQRTSPRAGRTSPEAHAMHLHPPGEHGPGRAP